MFFTKESVAISIISITIITITVYLYPFESNKIPPTKRDTALAKAPKLAISVMNPSLL